jgi:high-affinity iron transporter
MDPHYTVLDAAGLLLREGLEALLVVVALLTILQKRQASDQTVWIWGGAATGVLASVATALAIQSFWQSFLTEANQEALQGAVSLVAAGMLLYVSFWLHSQSAAGSWQHYLRETAVKNLDQKELFSLGILACLAIYREGAETILLYLGMAQSITQSDLWLGLGLGVGLLSVVAWLMLGLGLRIPLRPFFWGTSLIIYGLSFKFIGNGIHDLQEAGIILIHSDPMLIRSRFLGLYPTWETTVSQLLLLGGGLIIFLSSWLKVKEE